MNTTTRTTSTVRITTKYGAYTVTIPQCIALRWARKSRQKDEDFWLRLEILNAQFSLNDGGHSYLTQEDICAIARIIPGVRFPDVVILDD